jgi:hypothetical protein
MRPLRCSMRLGFQGTSKWKRSAQWFWRFTPSRAASVATRTRSGCSAGSPLKARLISSRRSSSMPPWKVRMRSSARSVDGEPGEELLLQVALGVRVFREHQHAAVVPAAAVEQAVLPHPREEATTRGVGAVPRAASAISAIFASRARSRSSASPVGRATSVATSIAASSCAATSSSGRSARSSSGPGASMASNASCHVSAAAGRAASPPGPSPRCGGGRAACRRRPRSTRAAASGGSS